MTTVIDLLNLGSQGFVISGGFAGDLAGFSVASAGDINGDGYADMIVGSPQADPGGRNSGEAFVIFGKKGGLGPIDLGHLSLADGFAVTGQSTTTPGDQAGTSVSSAGDFNGDGYDDFLVGSPGDLNNAGAAYLIYGKSTGFTPLSLDSLSRDDGFKMAGGFGSHAGNSVSAAGDVNGDGLDDVIVGAPFDGSGGSRSGEAYVVFGAAGGYDSIDLDDIPTAKGFTIRGAASSTQTGWSVSTAGDLNGDGFADIVVGAKFGDVGGFNAGDAYVIFGKAGGFGVDGVVDLSNLAPTDGFTIQGSADYDQAGFSVSTAGDINSDGFADLIVGAPFVDGGAFNTGAAYVIYGKAGGFAPIDLGNFTSDVGFTIQGAGAGDNAGFSVSSAGDVNGDGFADLIIGAKGGDNGGGDVGDAYVIYGKEAGFKTIDLANLSDTAGFIIQGDTNDDAAGFSVSAAGDVNGDGFADVMVGAPYGDDRGSDAGNAYVIYGAAPLTSVVRFGTLIDNTIHGGSGDDILIGRAGDDTLIGSDGGDLLQGQGGKDDLDGGDGDDRLLGGVGDDIMHGGAGDDRMTGGRGNDVLYGGQGRDLLGGGDGADQFHFTATGSAPDAKNADRILDFFQVSHDQIDLSDFDAKPGTPAIDPFTFIGTAAFSGAGGELRYQFSGGDTLLTADTNGDRVADFTVKLDGQIALTASDFILTAPAATAAGAHAFLAQLDLHAGYLV